MWQMKRGGGLEYKHNTLGMAQNVIEELKEVTVLNRR